MEHMPALTPVRESVCHCRFHRLWELAGCPLRLPKRVAVTTWMRIAMASRTEAELE
jgi:hypothetical protein